MLWEEVLIDRNQVPEITSKPKPSKYSLQDAFFRKAFITKPEISESAAQFNRARTKKREMESKKNQQVELTNGLDPGHLFFRRL